MNLRPQLARIVALASLAALPACPTNDNLVGTVPITPDSGTAGPTDGNATGSTGGDASACGTKATTILDTILGSASLPGWWVNPTDANGVGKIPAVALSKDEVVALIDGAAEDFFAPPYAPMAFAWQNYLHQDLPSTVEEPNDGAQLSLYVFQMPSPEQAAGLYRSLLQYPLYAATWEPTSPNVGDESRIANTGATWNVNFHKCNYYVEIHLTPSYGPPPDYAKDYQPSKTAALAFAAAVAARI